MFSAVIFDFDGVLVNTEELGIGLEMAALGRIGLNYGRSEFIRRFVGLADSQITKIYNEEHVRQWGTPLPADFMTNMKAEKYKLFDDKICAIPGAVGFVEKLKLPIAVASSSRTEQLYRKIRRADLERFFTPHIYSTQLVERSKPSPDIYQLVAQKIGHSPNKCLVIEDSVPGVRAAVAAGMTAWGFLGGGHLEVEDGELLRDQGARQVFASYEEISSEFFSLYS